MKILVTGGAGYIGSHAVKEFRKDGHEVAVLDNLCTGNREMVPSEVPFFEVDLKDKEAVEKVFAENEFGAVVHFAALSSVEESMKEPEKYYENNVGGTLNLLEAMRENGVKKLVFSSTAAVYGEPDEMPITEETPTNPINSYGETKLKMEEEMRKRAEKGELDFVALRYFNVAGASEEGEIGEKREKETHLIPLVLERGLAGKEVYIFGTDYDTRDGTCVRDYINVVDLADAHVRALQFLVENLGGHVFNLGTGEGFSVKEILEVCGWVSGLDLKIVEVERREGDPPVLVASNEKAREVLKWQPDRSIEQTVRSAWEWFKKMHAED